MTHPDTPKDGDFAAFLERKAAGAPPQDAPAAQPQTLQDILVGGEEPTDAFIADFKALEDAPPLSDEELARQALEHPGADGDPSTPE